MQNIQKLKEATNVDILIHINETDLPADVSLIFMTDLEKRLSSHLIHCTTKHTSFRLTHEFKTANLIVTASASHLIPFRKLASAEIKIINIDLLPKPILSLNVLGDDGSSLPGATVQMRSTSKGIFISDYVTDASGQIDIQLPNIGEYNILVSHPLYPIPYKNTFTIITNPNHHEVVLSNNIGTIIGTIYNDKKEIIP